MLGTTFFGYLVITGKYGLQFTGYVAVHNSAWVGGLMAIFCTIMLTIVGFYLIRMTVERDRRTGVGQILASTPIGKGAYLLAKYVSSYLVLISCTVVLIGAAIIMQMFTGVPGAFDLVDLLTPFVVITLPMLGVVAGMAVLFESVRWLRGTVGNVLYLFAFETTILTSIILEEPPIDLAGLHRITSSMEAAILSVYPEAGIAMQVGVIGLIDKVDQATQSVFTWSGVEWTSELFILRLGYVVTGLAITGLATVFFDRFDPARIRLPRKKKRPGKSEKGPVNSATTAVAALSIGQISSARIDFSLYRMVIAELRLMLKGYHWSWYLFAMALVTAQLAESYDIVRMYILPAAFIWPLPIWSAMGTRERRFNTEQLLFSSASPLTRQFPAAWIAGWVITLAMASGMIVRTSLVGEWTHTVALLIAALFVPTLALALGTLTSTRKTFEVVYLMIWYVGSVDRLWALDFVGVTDESLAISTPSVFLMLTCVMLPISFLVRRYRLATT